MRNDFTVMKDLAVHTRLPPDQRQQEIRKFMDYIQKYAALVSSILLCHKKFDDQLLSCHKTLEILLILKKVKSQQKEVSSCFNLNLVF